MSKRLLALLLAGVVGLTGLALAQEPPAGDEPPVRLKKKKPRGDDKPKTEPAKPDDKKKDDKKEEKKAEPREAEPVTQQEEDKEVLQRVVKNVHSVEERLAKNDLGEATRQTQRDILKDIDALIHRSENPPQSGAQQEQNQGGGGGEGGEDSKEQQGGASGQQGARSQQGGGGQKSQGNSKGSRGSKGQSQASGGGSSGTKSGTQPGGGGKQASGKQPGGKQPGGGKDGQDKLSKKNDGKGGDGKKPGGREGKGGLGSGGGERDDRAMNRNADLYKNDVWGHLPETLRAQMDAYSNPQPFLPKYDELIKRYYRTIAEQGRRKGE